ncbi:MAG: DUF835 domain-containing protein [Methanomassiliicoccales archaeon]|nr:DUF835 domain-containing protein [Methanomassiliicoccales archaeon]
MEKVVNADLDTTSGEKFFSIDVHSDYGLFTLDHGRIYLVMNERLDKTLSLINSMATAGKDIICVSRMHPDLLRERYPLQEIHAVWLSQTGISRRISPEHLDRIVREIAEFVSQRKNAAAVLDGLEYISLFTDFRSLNIFLEELNDVVMASRSILLIPIDPRLFDPCQLARLRRFAEILH